MCFFGIQKDIPFSLYHFAEAIVHLPFTYRALTSLKVSLLLDQVTALRSR